MLVNDSRLLKVVFYSQLNEGKRTRQLVGQFLRYKVVLKRYLTARDISHEGGRSSRNRGESGAALSIRLSLILKKSDYMIYS